MGYKEIVTKAVVGKARKYYKDNYDVEAEFIPTTILGCWVINHKFDGIYNNNYVIVNGSFDVNIWYSYDHDSKTTVTSKTINYSKQIEVSKNDDSNSSNDIIVRSLKQPNCIVATNKDNIISLEIEKELGVEIIGDTKVKVAIEDDIDDWTNNTYDSDISQEIDSSINDNYLNKK